MKRLVLVLLVLAACVPEYVPPQENVAVPNQTSISSPPRISREFSSLDPTRTVKASDGSLFSLSENNTLLKVERPDRTWILKYERGRLAEIEGEQNVEFLYNQSRLSEIDFGARKMTFRYDSRGRLVEVRGGQEPLYFEYDSLDQIRGVRRGVAGKTSIDYDKEGRFKYITRGVRTVNVILDDKGRIRNFDGDDVKWILGYWRDDKLISLTGKAFGGGLAVSYGPGYPPTEAKVVHAKDSITFTAAYQDTLYTVVDDYLYCNYVRQLKEIPFEGESFAFFATYFGGDIAGYVAQQVRCLVYEN
ncbi:hypothetical protein C4580_00280 [Candidatus Woesearchaeota archaeon]|nr:MAG: hypothetical protein C4580_00280 [Candidatus Woesearchaeota archaeon]